MRKRSCAVSYYTLFQLECAGIKLIILSFLRDQLIMAAALDNPSLLENHDHIGTVDSLCAITNTVRPCISASIPFCTIASVLVSIEDVASSIIITGGSATAARAIEISCLCPWDRFDPLPSITVW